MASPSGQGHVSPASSPRLPSPPPFPEVQIGHRSPSPGSGHDPSELNADQLSLDQSSSRRIRPGTKSADMASGPPLVPLSDLDSPFQLQEHLKALYLDATRSDQSNTTVPITRETATILATPPDNVDRSLWLYELCRFLVQKTNSLIVGFFSDNPPCSAKDCPEMRASEWQYLCAVHDPPKSCCAIDYCCHTLDWAANILTSQKHFPSRLSLGGDAPGGSQASVRQLTNVFRRVYRMFAHAWFQHKDVFWNLENQEGIYVFYKTVCDIYQLIPEENYTIPPEAEGLGLEEEHPARRGQEAPEYNRSQTRSVVTEQTPILNEPEDMGTQTTISTGATTRRHKHTPSTGSFVTPIAEGDEEGDDSKDPNPPHDAASIIHLEPAPRPGQPAEIPIRVSEPLPKPEADEQSKEDTGNRDEDEDEDEKEEGEEDEEKEEEERGVKEPANDDSERSEPTEETPSKDPLITTKPEEEAEVKVNEASAEGALA